MLNGLKAAWADAQACLHQGISQLSLTCQNWGALQGVQLGQVTGFSDLCQMSEGHCTVSETPPLWHQGWRSSPSCMCGAMGPSSLHVEFLISWRKAILNSQPRGGDKNKIVYVGALSSAFRRLLLAVEQHALPPGFSLSLRETPREPKGSWLLPRGAGSAPELH